MMQQTTELRSSLLKNDSLYPTAVPVYQTSNGSDVAMGVPLTTVNSSLSDGTEQLQMPHTSLAVDSSGSGIVTRHSPQNLLLGDWLASVNPVLEQYEYPLGDWLGRQQLSHDRPLSNVEILVMVKDDQLSAGFEELEVKMPHRSAISNALKALKGSASDPRNESV